jgi:hypothetical protein
LVVGLRARNFDERALAENAMKFYFAHFPGLRKRRIRERAWRTEIWVAFGLLPLLAVTSFGQTPAAKPFAQGGKLTPTPFSHVYMHFLLAQNYLDKLERSRKLEGEDSSEQHDRYQKMLGFTPSEFAAIRAGARRLDSKLKANRAQVSALIQADRSARIHDPSIPPHTRTVSPEVRRLFKKREALILSAEADLDQKLGPKTASKLHFYLQNNFVRQTIPSDFRALPRPAPPGALGRREVQP